MVLEEPRVLHLDLKTARRRLFHSWWSLSTRRPQSPPPWWCTSSTRPHSLQQGHSPNSTTSHGPSFQTHESVGGQTYLNHYKDKQLKKKKTKSIHPHTYRVSIKTELETKTYKYTICRSVGLFFFFLSRAHPKLCETKSYQTTIVSVLCWPCTSGPGVPVGGAFSYESWVRYWSLGRAECY